jgi:predicted outer membrane repeat protein
MWSSSVALNSATANGGGIQCDGDSLTEITDVEILENEATRGGGFDVVDLSTLTMTDCWISGNEATNELTSGGFVELDSEWNKTNCTFDDPIIDENFG